MAEREGEKTISSPESSSDADVVPQNSVVVVDNSTHVSKTMKAPIQDLPFVPGFEEGLIAILRRVAAAILAESPVRSIDIWWISAGLEDIIWAREILSNGHKPNKSNLEIPMDVSHPHLHIIALITNKRCHVVTCNTLKSGGSSLIEP